MLYTYDQYLAEKEVISAQRELMSNIFKQFDDIKPVMEDAMLLVETGVFDLYMQDLNEENLFQKAKAKFDAAVQIAKEKGKQALSDTQEKIIKLGGNIVNVIKMIVEKLKEWMGQLWSAAQTLYNNAAKASTDKIAKSIEGKDEDYKNLLATEAGDIKNMSKGVTQWIASGFAQDTAKAAAAAAKEDDGAKEAVIFDLMMLKSINEAVVAGEINFVDLLEEGEGGIPFVSAIAHKMHNIPPFNALEKVKKAAEGIAGGVLNKISYYATELAGAPGPFKFVAIAAIIGIIAEVQFKGIAKHAILHAVPGLGLVASIISNVAMALAAVAIIETLIKKDAKKEE